VEGGEITYRRTFTWNVCVPNRLCLSRAEMSAACSLKQARSTFRSSVSFRKRFFAADALDFVSDFQRAVVFTERKTVSVSARTIDQGTQITCIILQVPNRRDACLAQRQFGDFADAVNHPAPAAVAEMNTFSRSEMIVSPSGFL